MKTLSRANSSAADFRLPHAPGTVAPACRHHTAPLHITEHNEHTIATRSQHTSNTQKTRKNTICDTITFASSKSTQPIHPKQQTIIISGQNHPKIHNNLFHLASALRTSSHRQQFCSRVPRSFKDRETPRTAFPRSEIKNAVPLTQTTLQICIRYKPLANKHFTSDLHPNSHLPSICECVGCRRGLLPCCWVLCSPLFRIASTRTPIITRKSPDRMGKYYRSFVLGGAALATAGTLAQDASTNKW